MSSLPVPVSPVTSTLLSLSAITRTKSKTARIRALRPTTTESTLKGAFDMGAGIHFDSTR